MNPLNYEWKLSIRDGDDRFLHKKSNKKLTKEETEKIKQEIIEHHKLMKLPENLKKEMYPTLFE